MRNVIGILNSSERIDKLGDYFVYHNLRERYGWTFEEFIGLVERGTYTVENGY